ncbi:hypothetical protein FHS22_000366 [Planomonospora venezuelensis]|uniref:Uncharacterized protein n=1 Tax=Planomonospora venezuelensis TaxID=1999 RepID=A0A841CYD7_PLAVE|nr:hypothetical protein [Planomonospora venezuelensis]
MTGPADSAAPQDPMAGPEERRGRPEGGVTAPPERFSSRQTGERPPAAAGQLIRIRMPFWLG